MMDATRTDGELLALFLRTGDDSAFEGIVQRHYAMVLGVCRRQLRRGQDAEDVAQTVFATLLQRSETVQGRASLAGWLYRVAWHQSRRLSRAGNVRRAHEMAAAEQRGGTEGAMGVAVCETVEANLELYRALSDLPEGYREALVLHHLEGFTVEETARLMECPVGTVAARLSRGREMLREKLQRRMGAADAATCVVGLGGVETLGTAEPVSLSIAPEVAAAQVCEAVIAERTVCVYRGSIFERLWTVILARPAAVVAMPIAVFTRNVMIGSAASVLFLGAVVVSQPTRGTNSSASERDGNLVFASLADGMETTTSNPGRSSNSSGGSGVSVPEPGAVMFPMLGGLWLARRRERGA